MKKGTVLISKNAIVGMVFKGRYLVENYSHQTWSNTKGGEKSRHWYRCKCIECNDSRIFERGRILGNKLPKCKCEKERKERCQ